MKSYFSKRLLTGFITIIFSFTLTFFLSRMSPGNPILTMAGRDNPNPDQIEYLNERYGLNDPLPIQFLKYTRELLRGNFGVSLVSHRPVLDIIKSRLAPTIILSLTATILSVFLGTLIGVYSGKNQGSLIDRTFTFVSYIVDSLPVFWLALILIVAFSTRLGLFPTSGMYSIRNSYEGFKRVLDLLWHMALPVLTIVIVRIPYFFRISRASTISVMNESFVKTLRATGMGEKKIFSKYVLRSALIPIITSLSMSLASVIAGVAFIEIVFAWPGMGRVLMDAIGARDYPVISGLYLFISLSVTAFMLVTELIYVIIDPRMKLE